MRPQTTSEHIIDIIKAILTVAIVAALQALVPIVQELLAPHAVQNVAYAASSFATIKLFKTYY